MTLPQQLKEPSPHRVHHVSADRTHVKDAAEHVARAVGIGAHVVG